MAMSGADPSRRGSGTWLVAWTRARSDGHGWRSDRGRTQVRRRSWFVARSADLLLRVFSLFPLLVVLATVTGFFIRDHPDRQAALIHSALAQFPVVGANIEGNVHALNGSGDRLDAEAR